MAKTTEKRPAAGKKTKKTPKHSRLSNHKEVSPRQAALGQASAQLRQAALKQASAQARLAASRQAGAQTHFSEEGLARLRTGEGVFFNPFMRQCRDLSSLWVATLPKLANVLDGFCASGARGLRYKLENENVGKVMFLDLSEKAVEAAKKNARLNKVKSSDAAFVRDDIARFLLNRSDFDLIEIDPFGSPAPHLHAVMRAGYNLPERYLSITATDMAVLCGAHAAACWKNYGAKPMDNEFCHENALRILLGRVARAAAEENWSVEPQFCYSHRHYLKLLLKLKKGADGAVECAKLSMRYAVHCPKCLYHAIGKFPSSTCPDCGKQMNYAGPMWGGKWADGKTIEGMQMALAERPYLDNEEIGPLLSLIQDECEGPALYYDLHELASRHKMKIPKSEDVIAALTRAGYFCSRTHFSPTAIRTDAPLEEIVGMMKKI